MILLNKNDPTLVLTVRKYIGEMLFPCSRFPYNQRLLEETKKILDLANKISDDLYSNTQIEKKIEHNLLNEQQ